MYILERTGGAIGARVAARLGVRAPSVTQALRRLEAAGWLQAGPDRLLHLTPDGERLAEHVMRRHRVLERWLIEGLGLDWAAAHSEAQRMEHAVGPEIVDRLYEALGRPETCPHGNPIPGPAGLPPYGGSLTADALPLGAAARVVRIAEDAEEDAGSLARFDELGLRPGATVRALERRGDALRLATTAGEADLDLALAAKVWVDPAAPR